MSFPSPPADLIIKDLPITIGSKPLGFNHSDGLTSSQKSNIFMLEKSILPYFEKRSERPL
jgi:hypothetical protein